MMEAGMQSSGIYHVGKAELLYSSESLKVGMLNDVEDQFVWNSNKTKYRVVDYLVLVYFQNIVVIPQVGITIADYEGGVEV